jgi:hypothetical protein
MRQPLLDEVRQLDCECGCTFRLETELEHLERHETTAGWIMGAKNRTQRSGPDLVQHPIRAKCFR